MMNSGTDPNPEKALEPQPDEGTSSTLAGQMQPQKEGGQMPHPKPEEGFEQTLDEYMELPWVKKMFDGLHESQLKEGMREFSEEYVRLWRRCWASFGDHPHWKIAIGREEEKLVDEALKAQHERKYKKPRAVLCEDGLIFSLLCVARDLLEVDRGSITPAENLIRTLLISANAKPLTPEDVENDVDEFRDNFETAQETAKFFLRQYPELVQSSAIDE